MSGFDITQYAQKNPAEVRALFRTGALDVPTAGMCRGYAQANLMILPRDWAQDFRAFTAKNPFACPVLEVIEGTPESRLMARGGNIATDLPAYFLYENGVRTARVTDISAYWTPDSVGFLIGCSFSFEEALMRAGIEMRHIATGRNVPMYKTNRMTVPVGAFSGPIVCSMRPMTPENAKRAQEITACFPNVHGAPLHMGDPAALGIDDIMQPDYGDAVELYPGEIPVFWPCGVTPQAAVEQARPPLAIAHAPGHMFLTDIRNDALNDFLEQQKQD